MRAAHAMPSSRDGNSRSVQQVNRCPPSCRLTLSRKTEKAYLDWSRFFVLWSAKAGGMRHPRDMGGADGEAFLTLLANARQVSPATHRQALNALLFLYREVLGLDQVSHL
jgi:hypothetical protein